MLVRRVLTILALFLFLSCSSDPEIENQSEQIVYVTRTGEKYHREDCRHLRKSKAEIPLDRAIKEGYQACQTCVPERLND